MFISIMWKKMLKLVLVSFAALTVAVDGFGVMSWASSNKNPVGNVSEIELGGSTTEATPRKRSLGYQVVIQTSHTFSSRASSRN